MAVEIRHLRTFLSIARQRNLGRAAEELHLSQPAVSRTLQQLEKALRVVLIDRSTHHLEMTPAGKLFEERAAILLRDFDLITAPLSGDIRPLRVGHTWAALGALTLEVFDRWRESEPGLLVELHRVDDRFAGLLEGQVDIAILRDRDPIPELVMHPLFREPRVVAIAEHHPLANERVVTFADLSGQTLISNVVSGATRPSTWPNGTHPADRIPVKNMDDWALQISIGNGYGLASESMRHLYPYPGITYLTLTDAAPVQVDLAWPRHGAHPLTQTFVRIAEQTVVNRTSSREDAVD